MKRVANIIVAATVAIALTAAPSVLSAQTRSNTSTARSTETQNRGTSSSTSRSTSASSSTQTNRSSATQQRSTATTTQRSSGTSATQQQRSTATTSQQRSTTTTQRSSGTSATQQQRSTTTTQRSSGTPATQQQRSTATTSQQRSTTTTQRSSGTPATQQQRSTATTSQRNTSTAQQRATTTTTQQRSRVASPVRTSGTNPQRDAEGNAVVTRKGLTSIPSAESRGSNERSLSPNGMNVSSNRDGFLRVGADHNVNRIPPRERAALNYDRPGFFCGREPHYFGYRIEFLPPHYNVYRHWGVDYYFYNNVYYRHWGGCYYVCRPPFGVRIALNLVSIELAAIRFAYYHNVYRTYDMIDDNYRTIQEQNRIIAQNNAILANQNQSMALNSNRALSAYQLANQLGLVQNYANASEQYYYEDGVFFVINKGQYEVIIPPAGALVGELPDDYEVIVLNGIEYYRVDDTVYRTTLVDGTPYLEVLGQMPSAMASKYYYN